MKVFTNCRLFDPYTDAVLQNVTFFVTVSDKKVNDGRICGLFFDGEKYEIPENSEIIDLGNKIVVAGFIDAHVHCESTLLVPSRTTFIAERGTVVCIADPHEITNVLGEDGFNLFLDDSQNAYVDYRFAIPSCVPATDFETSGSKVTAQIVEKIFKADIEKAASLQKESKYGTNCRKVIGLAEVMNVPGVLDPNCTYMQEILSVSRELSAHMDGHSPSFSGQALNTYISAGISTDHECTTQSEMVDRIRRGMAVLIREGTAGHNAVALCKALSLLPRAATQRCCFCTDDRRIDDILEEGHIDNCIRIAVKCGININDAIRMATINPAKEFNLVDYGSITPGKLASFSVLQGELEDFSIGSVFIRGRPISPVNEKEVDLTGRRINVMNVNMEVLTDKLNNAQFSGPAIGVIPNQLVTTSEEPNESSLMLAVCERYTGASELGTCLINNISLNPDCAVASTVAHDSHNLVCVGSSKAAMLKAMEGLVKCGGGYSVANGDKLEVLPLPIAGLMTNISQPELLQSLHSFRTALHEAGASDKFDLMMTLSFMCLPVIPKLKLTNKGLFDAEFFHFVKQ